MFFLFRDSVHTTALLLSVTSLVILGATRYSMFEYFQPLCETPTFFKAVRHIGNNPTYDCAAAVNIK